MTCFDTPKLWRDMTREEKGALLLADHEGRQIELWLKAGMWVRKGAGWNDGFAYRVRMDAGRHKQAERENQLRARIRELEAQIADMEKILANRKLALAIADHWPYIKCIGQ